MLKKTARIFIILSMFLMFPHFSEAANFPLEIIQPRAGQTINDRFYRAYPSLEYNVRAAVIHGAYPFTYELTTAPSGMTINSDTGEISWANPTTSGSPHNVTLLVTDAENSTATVSWTVTVTTTDFYFVDAVNGHSVSEGGTGTISNPWKTLKDAYGGNTLADRDVSYIPNGFVYFRQGTYLLDAYLHPEAHGVPFVGGRKFMIWLAYPGEEPTFDLEYNTERSIRWESTESRPIYMDGINFTKLGRFGLYLGSHQAYSVFRRMNMSALHSQIDGSNNQSFFFVYAMFNGNPGAAPGNKGYVWQDNVFYDLDHGAAIKLYQIYDSLIEDNNISHIYDSYAQGAMEGIALKQDVSLVTVRHNIISDFATGTALGGNQDSTTWKSENNEYCYNYVNGTGATPWAGVLLNENNNAGIQYIYRNTLVNALIRMRNADSADGPFYINNNVIQNSSYYSLTGDATRAVIVDDLTGTSGLVDSSGLLVNRSYVGTYGWETGSESSDAIPPASPSGFSVN